MSDRVVKRFISARFSKHQIRTAQLPRPKTVIMNTKDERVQFPVILDTITVNHKKTITEWLKRDATRALKGWKHIRAGLRHDRRTKNATSTTSLLVISPKMDKLTERIARRHIRNEHKKADFGYYNPAFNPFATAHREQLTDETQAVISLLELKKRQLIAVSIKR